MTGNTPELRTDPVTGRQVIIAPLRAGRPGAAHDEPQPRSEDTREGCPFCAGREEATPPETFAVAAPGRAADSPGWRVRVVPNKFPALGPWDGERRTGLLTSRPARGQQEVVIHTPRHVLTLADLTPHEAADVAVAWTERATVARDQGFGYLHVAINEGPRAGATLPHTHSQLYSLPDVPSAVASESARAVTEMIAEERRRRGRVVLERDGLVVLCPFASRFPYEVVIAPVEPEPDAFASGSLPTAIELLGEGLRRVRGAVGWASANAWLVTSPWSETGPTHWRLVLSPRLTTPAAFELGLDVAINPVPPEKAAAALREA